MRSALRGSFLVAAMSFAGLGANAARADENHDLAMKALAAMGAEVPGTTHRCSGCHSITVPQLNDWKGLTQYADWQCFNTAAPTTPEGAIERINCFREDPSNANSPFNPKKLGIYAAGVHLASFETLFQTAYPTGWQLKHKAFKDAVQMPFDGHNKASQEEFDAMLKWSQAGMPYLETIVGGAGDPPTSCTTEIKPELLDHLHRMATEGWAAKNRDAGLQMFGCSAVDADALSCLTMTDSAGNELFPDVRHTTFGINWASDMPEAKFRILRALPYSTSYWMRSSADGRFLANGAYDSTDPGHFGGRIADLEPSLTPGAPMRDVKVAAAFDPGFFPDNSGFMFQGTPVGAGFCRTSILENTATQIIDFSQPECSGASNISLYQAIGASLDGSDYVAITGGFAGDSGSGGTSDGGAYWGVSTYATVVPIVNDGQKYKSLDPISVFAPYLGDWGLSPSNLLTQARISGVDANGQQGVQMGYRFSFLQRTATDSGYTAELVNAGTICAKGGKGGFSYDDRFFTTMHYVSAADYAEMGYASAEDPAFKALTTTGSANVIVMDLATGKFRRITRMGPGQYAYFPHFRSDGWIYYMVFDSTTGKRYAAATDAAILMARGTPIP